MRSWRTDEARRTQMPPYIIATDAVLRGIAQVQPRPWPPWGPCAAWPPRRSNTTGPPFWQP
ncbi:MAG: HRDC domain-containing protein [Thermoplasmatota archaeon]